MRNEDVKDIKKEEKMEEAAGMGTGAADVKGPEKAAEAAPDLEVVFILDRSGSMAGLEDDTIGGFNSVLKEQKAQGHSVIWSTVLFDHTQEVIHDRLPIEEIDPITKKEYWVRGNTAMLDAVGGSIRFIGKVQRYERQRAPKKTLFVITTDGMENSSVRYSYRAVKDLITNAKEKLGWEFMFLGANIDAEALADHIGIGRERAASYVNDPAGISVNYGAISKAMACMTVGRALNDEVFAEVREDHRKRGGRR
ncbi:MAG: VWA domain-containing protein [Firmicutes bacterium]|nr:VWA domain-containing protein [Bacillota bacterium]